MKASFNKYPESDLIPIRIGEKFVFPHSKHFKTMDALDEQLAQLKLMTSRALSPKNTSTSGSALNSGDSVSIGGSDVGLMPIHHQQQASGTLSKKIGPAVPPKPLKKSQVAGEIAQSSEPIRKQNAYSNMKMTLDNSIILDQQLEALEHHKKQLEKRAASVGRDSVASGPASLEKDPNIGASPSGGYHVYTNVDHLSSGGGKPAIGANPDAVVYSNIRYQVQQPSNSEEINAASRVTQNQIVYSNVGFGELPPPPPFEIPPVPAPLNLALDSSNFDYRPQTNEDDLPPPPSPVSSSYSELRRATDNFPQMSQYAPFNRTNVAQTCQPANKQVPSLYHAQRATAAMLDQSTGDLNTAVSRSPHFRNDPQQIYANAQYQNVYSSYEPNSQATGGGSNSSEYYGYGDLSQSLSNYESIYEPINPRPPSQLSSRSNYSLYTSYVNGSQIAPSDSLGCNTMTATSTSSKNGIGQVGCEGKLPGRKEAEVEALTNLLVHSMDSGTDIDSYGICVKCGERVVGESSGCTAMEQIYHINCFTCSECNMNLQGKPFYAFDGEPYCEEDYLNTLEKCSVCMKPILERILRATGKPYHPGCFCCVVCGNSLDGIPFTVDATNQNYCIEDFHKKFAPRCCVCQQPIMPEPGQEETVRVVALDRSFHFKCYKCEDCGLLLSSEAEGRGCYPLDDHVLCKSCNAQRVQALTNRMTTEL